MTRTPIIRRRRDADLGVLAAVLAEQQPASGYPYRWPLPFAVERFLVRDYEEAAWVAQVADPAAPSGPVDPVVGHVMVGSVEDMGEVAETFREATGCPDPAIVSVLFTATSVRGQGIGGRLLDTATEWARQRGRVPVLDVIPLHASAMAVYRHRGWVEVGRTRFDWLPDGEPDVLLMALPPFRSDDPPETDREPR